ncbi:MAG: biotin-dependent carboxyltransferase family protein [Desulfobacteraceae bacterium]
MGTRKTLEILTPGPLTTVQDLGRYGYGRYGVPSSGALDAFSLRIANLLVGNKEDEAGLEITLLGPKVKALTDCTIAITGADLQPQLNGKPLQMWGSHIMRHGDILYFRGPQSGCRAYLAIGGGISVTPVMGSKSTNLTSHFGGYEGRPLQQGDILRTDSPHHYLKAEARAFDPAWIPSYSKDYLLRVLPGPQDEDFAEDTKEQFLETPFDVTPQSDRTGIRLAGPGIQKKTGMQESIISEGVVPGTIQVPGGAQPIIILVETITGGYRKIATVISADLPLLGQIKPGDTVSFKAVSMEQALEALEHIENVIRMFKDRL